MLYYIMYLFTEGVVIKILPQFLSSTNIFLPIVINLLQYFNLRNVFALNFY
jgi:hypothetical protein